MNVAEMIELLKQKDPNSLVFVTTDGGGNLYRVADIIYETDEVTKEGIAEGVILDVVISLNKKDIL